MLSDLQLVYMVPRNSTQLLNINTTKFKVEREPVYGLYKKVESAFAILNNLRNRVFGQRTAVIDIYIFYKLKM